MPLLLVCVVLFFSLAQLYQWSNGIALPFPVLLLTGAGLAIASNLKPRSLSDPAAIDSPAVSVTVSRATDAPSLPPDIRPAIEPHPVGEPQLPTFAPPPESVKSISFKLKQAEEEGKAIEP